MLESNSPLLITLLICVANALTKAQECGVMNDNQQRIQMQGPPGKMAEVDYEKIKQFIEEAMKAEKEVEIDRGQIAEIVEEAIKAEMASVTTEVNRMQSRLEDTRLEMILNKVNAEESRKSEIPIILGDILVDIMSGNDRNLSLQQLPSVFQAIPQTPDEVKDLAVKYEAEKKYAHSIILYYSAGVMDMSTGDKGVEYKQHRVQNIKQVGDMMRGEGKDFTVFKFWVIPLMEELLEQLIDIPGASYEHKVEYQSWCLKDIGFFYYYLGDFENQLNKNKLCTDTMKQLRRNANNYRIYAICLHDTAAALNNLGYYRKAVPYYEKAIKAYKSAADFPSEADRQAQLALVNDHYEDVKGKLVQFTFEIP